MTEEQAQAVNEWLRQCRGVCFLARDVTTLWEQTHKASGVDSRLVDFITHCRRIGLDFEPHYEAVKLDFNKAPELLRLAEEDQGPV